MRPRGCQRDTQPCASHPTPCCCWLELQGPKLPKKKGDEGGGVRGERERGREVAWKGGRKRSRHGVCVCVHERKEKGGRRTCVNSGRGWHRYANAVLVFTQ